MDRRVREMGTHAGTGTPLVGMMASHTRLRHALRVGRRWLLARELPGAVGHRGGLRAGARVQAGRYARATRLLAV